MFSLHDVPGLYDAFGTDRFDDLYAALNEMTLFQERLSVSETHSGPPEGERLKLVVSTS